MITRRNVVAIILFMALIALAGFWLLSSRPGLGAALAKPLRGVIGNGGVAQLETIFFVVEDSVKQAEYELGFAEPEVPWEPAPPVNSTVPATAPPPPSSPTPEATMVAGVLEAATTLADAPAASLTPTPSPTLPLEPSATATPASWSLSPVPPLGELQNEGIWQPYLTNEPDNVVAMRTFLQPDPERPYAIAAIVAFDLAKTRLHYVLGSEEPSLPAGPRGSGYLKAADREPGLLLATFNGGFMASHGQYGAMADGVEALPAKVGYATVTIGEDDSVQIGEWANDITPDGAYRSWRQNARLITQNGTINDRVFNGSAATWGSSINGDIVTWRSALGLNESGDVLYFVAGPSLSMPSLANALAAVGAHNSLLLDINETWVHFAAIETDGDVLTAVPLFPEGMAAQPDRYLRQSARDFFYLTVNQ